MYRTLNGPKITETLERLTSRIAARFPNSGLKQVSLELLHCSRESSGRIARMARPHWPVRIATGAVIVAVVAALILAVVIVPEGVSLRVAQVADLLQGLEAAVNEIVLLSLALFFLCSLEGRLKRREALASLHELRSIAHVIDMHQLTKDPEAVLCPQMATSASPVRQMTVYELSRYLDYCSELLSLASKVAALYVQHLRDPVVLDAVNDVESLAHGLSQKIWQKIQVLETIATAKESSPRGSTPGVIAKSDGDNPPDDAATPPRKDLVAEASVR